jgi:hypothetical protein
MAPGSVFTVTIAVTVQPEVAVKVIVALPGATPVAIPVADPMVAMAVLLLLQVPPLPPHDSSVLAPGHTCITPIIGPGGVLTVTMAIAAHPVVAEV